MLLIKPENGIVNSRIFSILKKANMNFQMEQNHHQMQSLSGIFICN